MRSSIKIRDRWVFRATNYLSAFVYYIAVEGVEGTKSRFHSAFTLLPKNISLGVNLFVVVDRGYLLHNVVRYSNDSIKGNFRRVRQLHNHQFRQNVGL